MPRVEGGDRHALPIAELGHRHARCREPLQPSLPCRGSVGRAMSRLLRNGLKSVNPRGYQGGQEWLWWALTYVVRFRPWRKRRDMQAARPCTVRGVLRTGKRLSVRSAPSELLSEPRCRTDCSRRRRLLWIGIEVDPHFIPYGYSMPLMVSKLDRQASSQPLPR